MHAETWEWLHTAMRQAAVPVPDELAAGMAGIGTAEKQAPKMMIRPDNMDVVAAACSAIRDGRNPHTDKKFREIRERAAVNYVDWGTGPGLWAGPERDALLAAHAEGILDFVREAMRQAGEVLDQTAEVLRPVPIENQAGYAIENGCQDEWVAAGGANARVQQLERVWSHIVTSRTGERRIVGLVPDIDLARLDGIGEDGDLAADPWTLTAVHGVLITGSTAEEYEAAWQRIADERAGIVSAGAKAEKERVLQERMSDPLYLAQVAEHERREAELIKREAETVATGKAAAG